MKKSLRMTVLGVAAAALVVAGGALFLADRGSQPPTDVAAVPAGVGSEAEGQPGSAAVDVALTYEWPAGAGVESVEATATKAAHATQHAVWREGIPARATATAQTRTAWEAAATLSAVSTDVPPPTVPPEPKPTATSAIPTAVPLNTTRVATPRPGEVSSGPGSCQGVLSAKGSTSLGRGKSVRFQLLRNDGGPIRGVRYGLITRADATGRLGNASRQGVTFRAPGRGRGVATVEVSFSQQHMVRTLSDDGVWTRKAAGWDQCYKTSESIRWPARNNAAPGEGAADSIGGGNPPTYSGQWVCNTPYGTYAGSCLP